MTSAAPRPTASASAHSNAAPAPAARSTASNIFRVEAMFVSLGQACRRQSRLTRHGQLSTKETGPRQKSFYRRRGLGALRSVRRPRGVADRTGASDHSGNYDLRLSWDRSIYELPRRTSGAVVLAQQTKKQKRAER